MIIAPLAGSPAQSRPRWSSPSCPHPARGFQQHYVGSCLSLVWRLPRQAWCGESQQRRLGATAVYLPEQAGCRQHVLPAQGSAQVHKPQQPTFCRMPPTAGRVAALSGPHAGAVSMALVSTGCQGACGSQSWLGCQRIPPSGSYGEAKAPPTKAAASAATAAVQPAVFARRRHTNRLF